MRCVPTKDLTCVKRESEIEKEDKRRSEKERASERIPAHGREIEKWRRWWQVSDMVYHRIAIFTKTSP